MPTNQPILPSSAANDDLKQSNKKRSATEIAAAIKEREKSELKSIEKENNPYGKFTNARDASSDLLKEHMSYSESQIAAEEEPMMKLFMQYVNMMIEIQQSNKSGRDAKRAESKEFVGKSNAAYKAASTREEKQELLDSLKENKNLSYAERGKKVDELTAKFKENRKEYDVAKKEAYNSGLEAGYTEEQVKAKMQRTILEDGTLDTADDRKKATERLVALTAYHQATPNPKSNKTQSQQPSTPPPSPPPNIPIASMETDTSKTVVSDVAATIKTIETVENKEEHKEENKEEKQAQTPEIEEPETKPSTTP